MTIYRADEWIAPHVRVGDILCRCGAQCSHKDIDDAAHTRTVEFFRRVGEMMKDYPYRWTVTSGLRCPEHNANVGGKGDSAHVHRVAVDIQPQGPWGEVWGLAERAGFFSAIIAYPKRNLIHLDVHPSDRVVRGYNFGDGCEHYLTLGTRESAGLDPLLLWNLDETVKPPAYIAAALDRETTA